MAYLVGVDEAGYGPNLGPLVISASVWQVPDAARDADLYGRLGRVISSDTRRPAAKKGSSGSLAIADSKALYKAGQGLAALERGVLAASAVLGATPGDWLGLWDALAPQAGPRRQSPPWHVDFVQPVPVAADVADLALAVPLLASGLAEAGVRLVQLRSTALFPRRFNELTEACGNKGEVLSRTTLRLVAEVVAPLAGEPVLVVCDKHGGRNRYGAILQEAFPDQFVEVRQEAAVQSVYRFGPAERRVEIRFRVGGEEFLPAALASMASKYLRELAMLAFNDFWRRQVPGLRATAGYPQDARRFKQEISAAQASLGVDDLDLWRQK
ncbi:MAG: hypothetical protein ACYC35_02380 [Pirellulales bacterium]